MVKKIIVGLVIVGISAGLIYGGVYRTIERTSNNDNISKSQQGKFNSLDNSNEKGQGRGGRGENQNEQLGSASNYSGEQINLIEYFSDLIIFNGTVTNVDKNILGLLSDAGEEIIIEDRPWRFAVENGFIAEIGDAMNIFGFYEDENKFEASYIQNLTKGIEFQIRDINGRPLWAGNGRG